MTVRHWQPQRIGIDQLCERVQAVSPDRYENRTR
jgi:hypothetical protein